MRPCEAAYTLGVSDRTVRRLIRAGKLRAKNIGAGKVPRYAVSREDVETFGTPVAPSTANAN
jgi:excisionase family DNA binding protein